MGLQSLYIKHIIYLFINKVEFQRLYNNYDVITMRSILSHDCLPESETCVDQSVSIEGKFIFLFILSLFSIGL